MKDYEAGDFFSCLLLPGPDCDDVGRPLWDVTEGGAVRTLLHHVLQLYNFNQPFV